MRNLTGFKLAMGLIQSSIMTLYFYFTVRYIGAAWWVFRDPEWEPIFSDTHQDYFKKVGLLKQHIDNETKFLVALRSLQSMRPYKILSSYHCVCWEESGHTKRSREQIVAALDDRDRPMTYGQVLKLGVWIFAHWSVWSVVTLLTSEVVTYMDTI